MFRTTVILLCTLISGKYSFSQDLIFRHYTVNDGLGSSQVDDIIQDKYNRLWFTTDHGLSCYDGYNFKNYTSDDGLPANTLFKFYPGYNGEIWCSSFSKRIFSFSGYKPVFSLYAYNDILNKLPDSYVTNSLFIAKNGSMYMGVVDGIGYIKIDKDGRVTNKLTHGKVEGMEVRILPAGNSSFHYVALKSGPDFPSGIGSKQLRCPGALVKNTHYKALYMPSTGYTVIGCNNQITIMPPNGKLIKLQTEYIAISVGALNDSLIWVGFLYGGVHVYNLKGIKKASYLPGHSVTKLLIDHENGYWLSTLNDGVFHAANTSMLYYPHEEKQRNWVHNLTAMPNGDLYVGYYSGEIVRIHKQTAEPFFTSKEKKPALTFYNAATDHLFYHSDYNVYSTEPAYKPVYIAVNAINIMVNKNDSCFLSAYSGFLLVANGKRSQVILGHRVTDMCILNDWYYLATYKGLFRWKPGMEQPVAYLPEKFGAYKLVNLEPFNGGLLMASREGLLYWRNNQLKIITRADGLAEPNINNVYVQNDSVVWTCSNLGMNRIVYVKKGAPQIQIINTRHGLAGNEISDIEIVNDTVWVGTHQGLCCFPLKMLIEKNKAIIQYKPLLTALRVNDRTHAIENGLELPYYKNRIEIYFKGISFDESRPLLYRYILQGLESKWNYTTSRSALYTSLPNGNYKFILQVKGNNTDWRSAGQSFSFIIRPPFWKTWWFLITVTVGIIILVYLFFRFRILSYNRDITRELLRQLLKRIRKKPMYVVVREQGKDIRIPSGTICFVKSDGNYIEIHTDAKKYVTRYKIGEFLDLVPDPLEYLRISRSCIVRLDKVQEKSKKDVTVKGEKLPVGETYLDQLEKIKF